MSLVEAFRDGLREGSASMPTESELLHLCGECQAEFSGFSLSPETFVGFLAERASTVEELHELALRDLFLACACVNQDPEAVRVFRERYSPEIRQVLSQLPEAHPHSDEIEQEIFAALLVRDGKGKAGIESYRGKGSLFSWLRIIAIRRAFRILERFGKTAALEEDRLVDQISAGPDLRYMKELYRDSFRRAFSQALQTLAREDRSFLRQHYVHGLSIDKLGRLHDIHRATAARRLAKSREELLQFTRRTLLRDLRIDAEELDSIMRLIGSNLEVSMAGLLDSSES